MPLNLVEEIKICEVGPRDGLQNEKRILTTEEKLVLIEGVVQAGFSVIEVGSFMSPKAVPQMANTDEVFQNLKRKEGVEYRALVANLKGVERAAACGCKKVKLNVSASKAHNLANLNRTPAETVEGFYGCMDAARSVGIEEIVDAYLAVGVTEISLSDASGQAYPTQVYQICTDMAKTYPQVAWWLHFHNTRGLGIANIMAGMQAGFTRYDSACAGVGGCPFVPGAAGNVATEDVVHMCDEIGIKTGVDLDQAMKVSRQLIQLLNHGTDSYLLRAGKSSDLISELPTGQLRNQTLK